MKAQTQKDIERMRQDNEDSRYYDESAVGGDNGNELKKLQQEADKIRKEFEIKNKQHAETVRANKANEEIKRKQVNKKPTGK